MIRESSRNTTQCYFFELDFCDGQDQILYASQLVNNLHNIHMTFLATIQNMLAIRN